MQNFQWNLRRKKNYFKPVHGLLCEEKSVGIASEKKKIIFFIKVAKQDFFSWDGGVFFLTLGDVASDDDDGAEK